MSDKVSLNKSNEKVKKVSYGAGFLLVLFLQIMRRCRPWHTVMQYYLF